MIYTVTCNPALDCAVQLNGLTVGALNRTAGATLIAGGKGVNGDYKVGLEFFDYLFNLRRRFQKLFDSADIMLYCIG